MRKIMFLIVTILLIAGIIWYLFLKPYDYLVSFKEKTYPGTIGQQLKVWANNLENTDSVYQKIPDGIIVQKLKFGDSIYTYEWEMKVFNDSLTKVNIYVTDDTNSFQNKLTIPFGKTEFEKITEKTVRDFAKQLNDHLGDFKISSIDTASVAPNLCAYISVKTTQIGKAGKMMYNFPILDGFLFRNQLEPAGSPFIEITSWDRTNDSITYDFCYPIERVDSLPSSPTIKYKEFEGSKGLRTLYNGNYITSDRAWYALLAWAKKEGIEVKEKPIEIFHTNPNFGGNELEWEAEIVMPTE